MNTTDDRPSLVHDGQPQNEPHPPPEPWELAALAPKPPDTPWQGAWKEGRRLALMTGTFGLIGGAALGIFKTFMLLTVVQNASSSLVVDVIYHAVPLGVIGVVSGGTIGGLYGAYKAWRAAKKKT